MNFLKILFFSIVGKLHDRSLVDSVFLVDRQWCSPTCEDCSILADGRQNDAGKTLLDASSFIPGPDLW